MNALRPPRIGPRRPARVLALSACLLPAACASVPRHADLKEIFPHVHFDRRQGIVAFDAEVACDCHQPTTPRVYLEATACTPDTREYESLVVTRALPSHVHAALLLAGLVPGEPGAAPPPGRAVPAREPRGEGLSMTFEWRRESGADVASDPLDWIIDLRSGRHLSTNAPVPAWVFSGSRIVTYNGQERYEADLTGTLIGLTTFGSESIAFADVFSPDASVQEPAWVADIGRVPRVGTAVRVVISRAR